MLQSPSACRELVWSFPCVDCFRNIKQTLNRESVEKQLKIHRREPSIPCSLARGAGSWTINAVDNESKEQFPLAWLLIFPVQPPSLSVRLIKRTTFYFKRQSQSSMRKFMMHRVGIWTLNRVLDRIGREPSTGSDTIFDGKFIENIQSFFFFERQFPAQKEENLSNLNLFCC